MVRDSEIGLGPLTDNIGSVGCARGILHFNDCVGTANTEDSGYHETLTRFWAGIVGGFVRVRQFPSRFEAVREAVRQFGEDRDRHRLYYGFDVVRDRRARREWIEPDREPILR